MTVVSIFSFSSRQEIEQGCLPKSSGAPSWIIHRHNPVSLLLFSTNRLLHRPVNIIRAGRFFWKEKKKDIKWHVSVLCLKRLNTAVVAECGSVLVPVFTRYLVIHQQSVPETRSGPTHGLAGLREINSVHLDPYSAGYSRLIRWWLLYVVGTWTFMQRPGFESSCVQYT